MKSNVVTVHQAKTNLSSLIRKVESGEEVIIARGSKRVVRLIAFAEVKGQRESGSMKGTLVVGPEFFEALPPDEMSGWE